MQLQLTKPTLLVDETKVRKNIQRMARKASDNGIILRPHFKTHQSAEIAEWFVDAGITKATVSSVDMARYFAANGWKDISLAFPYNPLEYETIDSLAKEIKLSVLIASKEALDHLNKNVNSTLEYFIKIDVGTNRTGLTSEEAEEIKKVAVSTNSKHKLVGLLAHAGHSYQQLDRSKAQYIFDQSMEIFRKVKSYIDDPNLKISYGDTPTCTLLDKFPGVDEIRPGNFVFYDAMQYHFGVCRIEDIGVCLVCPVVSKHPYRNEAVIYGGAVHLSKDFIESENGSNYGYVIGFEDQTWGHTPKAHLDRLSQEHGIIRGSKEYIESLEIGGLVGILPVHSCLTADLQPSYVSLTGQQLNKLNKSGV